jgi:sec-independent protein translocase protein TatB
VFNLQGSEIIIIMLLALVVLGPEKLPDAMRRAGRMYADLKKMASGLQDEFQSALEEPLREVQETANLLRDSADFTKLAAGERSEKPRSATMGDASTLAPSEPDQIPIDELPFGPADPEPPSGTDAFDDLPEPTTAADAGTDEGATGPEPTTAADGSAPGAGPSDDEPAL